jgi:methyl-accepting chemotaxis protein
MEINAPILSRRKYFINKTFQINFILRFVVLIAFGSILSGIALHYYMSERLQSGSEIMYHNTMAILTPAIVYTQLFVGILIILIIAYVVLIFSHRIAGPLYRLERVAERVGNGDLTVKIGFREKDALLPLKSSFQNMIDNLQCHMLRIRDNVQELRIREKEIQESLLNHPLMQSEKDQLNVTISEFINRYEEVLKEFKLPEPKPEENSEEDHLPADTRPELSGLG